MSLWRRFSRYALVGLSVLALAGCSGTDDDNGGGGNSGGSGGGSGGSFQSDKEPKLSTVDAIQFSSLNIGQSRAKSVRITNAGQATLNLKKIQLVEKTGDGFDNKKEFRTGEGWVGKTKIKPRGSITLNVVYEPVNAQKDDGHILLKTNDPDNKTKKINLVPASLAPDIEAPDTVNFSSVSPGTQAARRVTIKNSGQVPLKINRLKLQGNDLFDATVAVDQSSGGGGNKNNGMGEDESIKPEKDDPLSSIEGTKLQPQKTKDLRVWFKPKDNSAESAKLIVSTNDPDTSTKTIDIKANAKTPCLGLSHKDEVNFGASSTGQVATKTVTVENCRSLQSDLEVTNIEVVDNAGGVFSIKQGTLPGELAQGKTFVIKGDNRANFVVTFQPQDNETYNGKLLVESNDPSRKKHEIDLVGKGSNNECPNAVVKAKEKQTDRWRQLEGGDSPPLEIDSLPLKTIEFDGSESSDPNGSVERYEWSIIERPEDSTARLTPNSSVERPEMFLDLAGTYKVELVVYDDRSTASCGQQAVVEIEAVPDEDIHVQLVWDTPADSDQTDDTGADLDLHYLNAVKAESWNRPPHDIFWENLSADWGQKGNPDDDPSLDIDDTDGAGPENVNHDNPSAGGKYAVGVYYYNDHDFGPSYATVRIYIRQELEREFKNKFMSGTFDFWEVGIIEWPSQNIYERDEKHNGFPN